MVARTLRGGVPPNQDRILAVRAYFDDVEGAEGRGDWFRGDTFPGYHWLFPTGGGSANLGVGMLTSTYPQSGRNLREMLLRLIAEDASVRGRLLGAPGCGTGPRAPAYDLQPAAAADRRSRDAARRRRRLINPLNGEGIQYALHSARWAAGLAADRLATDQLDAGSLAGYQRRVHQSLGTDLALSRPSSSSSGTQPEPRLAARPAIHRVPGPTDPDYAHHLGCVLPGLTPDVSAIGTGGRPGSSARRSCHRWPERHGSACGEAGGRAPGSGSGRA